jgi:uncharacterized protein YgbK (DUF1537 family)
MKSLIYAVAAASVLSLPIASFAQVQSNDHPLTRAEVKADLQRVEQAGYNPIASDPYYPEDIQAAEARVAAQQTATASAATNNADVGGAAAGAAQSGAPAQARPMNVDGVHPLYFGR